MIRFLEIVQRMKGLGNTSKIKLSGKNVCAGYIWIHTKENIPKGSVWKSIFTVPAMA